jgi:hypothetical protein
MWVHQTSSTQNSIFLTTSVIISDMAAFLDRRRGLAKRCLAFISLWHICLASPLRIEGAAWSNNFNDLKSLRRSTSSDASCPAGWLCEQQGCPANVRCPDGETCVNFEGTPVCAPSGTSWCALNPSTLQAVECVNGLCWYVKSLIIDAMPPIKADLAF